jgi:hypothetical protein
MDEDRANAIADAFLRPDPEARDASRARRAEEARALQARRVVALFVLVGFAIGALTAWAAGQRFTAGGVWGGIVGAAVGWTWVVLVDRWRRTR